MNSVFVNEFHFIKCTIDCFLKEIGKVAQFEDGRPETKLVLSNFVMAIVTYYLTSSG